MYEDVTDRRCRIDAGRLQREFGLVEGQQRLGYRTFPVSNDGQAALYIVREPAHPDAPPINITVGRQPLVGLTAPNWVRLDLPPKLYDLRAYGPQTNSELIITVAPGQTRFLLAKPTPTGGAELLELSQEQGRKLVRKGERLWTPELESEY